MKTQTQVTQYGKITNIMVRIPAKSSLQHIEKPKSRNKHIIFCGIKYTQTAIE